MILLIKRYTEFYNNTLILQDGWTPFHYASITGIVDIMKLLYQKDHNVIFAKANVCHSVYLCGSQLLFCVFRMAGLHYISHVSVGRRAFLLLSFWMN